MTLEVRDWRLLTHASARSGPLPTSIKAKALGRTGGVHVKSWGVLAQEPSEIPKTGELIQEKWKTFVAAWAVAIRGVPGPLGLVVADLNATYEGLISGLHHNAHKFQGDRTLDNLMLNTVSFFGRFNIDEDVVGTYDAAVKAGVIDLSQNRRASKYGVARMTVRYPNNPLSDAGLVRDYYSELQEKKVSYNPPVGVDVASVLDFLHRGGKLGGEKPLDLVRLPQASNQLLYQNQSRVNRVVEDMVISGDILPSVVESLGPMLALGLKEFADNAPGPLFPSILAHLEMLTLKPNSRKKLEPIYLR